jgi:hypothetical protein
MQEKAAAVKGGKILLFLKKKKQKDFLKRCAAGASAQAGMRHRPEALATIK